MENTMLLLNFSHPLRREVIEAVRQAAGGQAVDLREISVQFDPEQPFASQAKTLLDSQAVGISAREWQTEDIVIVPPAHAIIALTVIAELDGRMGHLPAVIRLKPEAGSVPTRFIFAEIIDLHQERERSRHSR